MCGRMRIIEWYPAAIRIFEGKGLWALLGPVRFLASVIYGVAVSVRRRSVRRSKRIAGEPSIGSKRRARIVSVGNLEIGGGGKTPCTMRLAEAIVERGGRPVVLMRGYRSSVSARRRFPFVATVDRLKKELTGIRVYQASDLLKSVPGRDPYDDDARTARLVGDEAALYHRRGIPVVIDSDRVRGAEAAVKLLAPTHILLDDGFQNLRIHKDIDILLLDANRPFGNGRLFPAGTLREPSGAVKRADIVIFTRATDETVPAEAAGLVRGTPIFFADHAAVDVARRDRRRAPLSSLEGKRVALYAGIARPESFEALIERTGAEPVVSFRFVDHHAYRAGDISRMLAQAPPRVPFLTTEKDWVKSKHLFPADIDLGAVRIRMEINDWPRLADLL